MILTKTNGSQSVTKAFGFYPQNGPKSTLLNPVPSKIVNDSKHEINGSLVMNNLTQSDFNTIKAKAIQLASSQYDLDDFNCADYAVSVFNSVRSNPLVSKPFFNFIPSPTPPYVQLFSAKNSPNGLYLKISDILEEGIGEWQNAKLDLSHNYRSPNTTGGCN